jgi:probable rRNA maturation factor
MPIPIQLEMTVQDCFEQEHGSFSAVSSKTWETWFLNWLQSLQPTLSPNHSYELCLRLTTDAEIRELNSLYRHQNQPTDVLAFASLEVDVPDADEREAMPLYLGDIVISIETARKQAQAQQHPLQQELAWLAAHGLLHLLGWDHPDEASLLHMLNKQDELLQQVGILMQQD